METGRTHPLGGDFTLTEQLDDDGSLIGYTVTGPAAPACPSPYEGRCGGLCAIKPFSVPIGNGSRKEYAVWQVSGEWPNITLSPSVACNCGGQHAYVQNGRWTGA